MTTTVNTSENTVTITEANNSVSVTNNKTGTSVDVTGQDISTVSISAPGPKGDKGESSYTAADNLTIQDLTVRHVTASGDISASGYIAGSNVYVPTGGKIGFDGPGGNDSISIISGQIEMFRGGTQKLSLQSKDVVVNNADLKVNGEITASGDISSSGTATVNKLSIDGLSALYKNHGGIRFGQGDQLPIAVNHITASGKISASSHIHGLTHYAAGVQPLPGADNVSFGSLSTTSQDFTMTVGHHTNPAPLTIHSNITASGEVSASGNIYSDNHESIPLSFQASGDATNWYGPNKQGPYYYVYNYNYGDNTAVTTLAQEYAAAGIIVPYKCQLIGYQAVCSHITQAGSTTISLATGSGAAATFDKTSGTAGDLHIGMAVTAFSDTPGAAENPMTISVTSAKVPLNAGDMIYPRIKTTGAGGAYVSMNILLKRRK